MTQPRAKNGRYRKAEPGERYAAQFRLIHGDSSTSNDHGGFPILLYIGLLALMVSVLT